MKRVVTRKCARCGKPFTFAMSEKIQQAEERGDGRVRFCSQTCRDLDIMRRGQEMDDAGARRLCLVIYKTAVDDYAAALRSLCRGVDAVGRKAEERRSRALGQCEMLEKFFCGYGQDLTDISPIFTLGRLWREQEKMLEKKHEKTYKMLGRGRYLDKLVETKLEHIHELETLAERCTAVISGAPHGGGGKSPFEDIVARIEELENELAEEMGELITAKRSIGEAVAKVKDEKHRLILEQYYLVGKSWAEIAEFVDTSERNVYYIRAEALRELYEENKDCSSLQ